MPGNNNTVNIEKRGYHHGDLREALLVEGLRLLATRDAEDLSLREVARGVGVSATSVYRHFPDKDALMAALAREGLARLAEAQRQASDAAGGDKAGFAATGRAYVRFALANPALFRLIFASPSRWEQGPEDGPKDGPKDGEAMAMLRANAAAKIGADEADPAARINAIHAWSLVHGLAMLMLDRQIPADDALIDRVITASG
jgi:AcrR family transcriptional regulator